MTTATATATRIYVGTYAKYNAGSLKGKWLDLEDYADADEFAAACAELHADEHDPELMFQDWEGIPEGMIGESHLSADVWEWLAMDEDDREVLAMYRAAVDSTATLEAAQEAYQGNHYSSEQDFAQELADDLGIEIGNTWPHNCIDWEQAARDLFMQDYTSHRDSAGNLWVFRADL
jgi:antirestriction protein